MERDETLAGAAPVPRPSGTIEVGAQAGGRYKILRYIASGAMGEVYAAEDLIIGTTVALKVLRTELTGNAAAIARVRREIALARKVTDLHVCRVHDVGEHEGRVFLTMELLEGKTLAEHVAANGALPVAEVERIAQQLIAGLAALHRAGVVHRDFKTANSMLVGSGDNARVVITDFGLARDSAPRGEVSLTADEAVIGTPAYMAPEQVKGQTATVASDIYALGIVLFELLTGARPFTGDSAMAIASARLTSDPPSPSSRRVEVTARWDAIVLRCLQRDPAKRFARVDDVLASGASPATKQRSRAWLGLGVAVVVAAGIGFVATRTGDTSSSKDGGTKPDVDIRVRQLTAFAGRARVSAIAMSHDGNQIAYQAGGALWLRDLQRSEATRFEHAGSGRMVPYDFFPDGRRLFVQAGEPGAFSLGTLELRDGSYRQWRTGIRYARLSPTGDRVAYLAADGVMVAAYEGSSETQVVAIPALDAYQLAWSADGKWIAVIVHGLPPNDTHIEVIAADGSRRETIATGPLSVWSGLAWAGSDRIFYSRGEATPQNVRDGSRRTSICSIGLAAGAWDRESPRCSWELENAELDWFHLSGRRLVFAANPISVAVETLSLDATGMPIGSRVPVRGQEGLTSTWGFAADGRLMMSSTRQGVRSRVIVQRADEAAGRVVQGGDSDDNYAVADGHAIVFTRTRADACELVRDRDGRQDIIRSEKRVGHGLCPYLRCALAIASRCMWVRFSANSYLLQRFDLGSLRGVGPERRRPTKGNVTLDLSPDGSTVVWAIEEDSDAAIALLELDSGNYRELRPKGQLRPHDVTWLPTDEGWLVAGSDDARTVQVIARLRPDGSYQRVITDPRPVHLHNPFVSLDGRTLAIQVEDQRNDIVALEGIE